MQTVLHLQVAVVDEFLVSFACVLLHCPDSAAEERGGGDPVGQTVRQTAQTVQQTVGRIFRLYRQKNNQMGQALMGLRPLSEC